jgi:tripartite-type tricarboxylate transporter receptor subunit TctC
MGKSKHVKTGFSILLLIFILIISACGGNSKTPASGTNSPASETAAPASAAPASETPAAKEVKFPTKNIKFIVPISPGGGMDTSARLLAKSWEKETGVKVIVENIPGAEYNNGIFAFLKEPADGHTVILFPGVIINQLFRDMNYDLNKFAWVGRVSSSAQVGVASKKSGIKSLPELIKKGTVKAGVTGFASSQTIGQLLSAKEMGFKPQPITHSGATEAVLSVIRGDSDWTTAPDITMIPYIQSGDVVPLYVASQERLKTLPDVPTLVELGFPKVVDIVAFDRIIAAHPDTDPAILKQLRESVKKAMEDPVFIEEYKKLGDAPNYLSGEQVAENVKKALELIAPNVDYINSFKK